MLIVAGSEIRFVKQIVLIQLAKTRGCQPLRAPKLFALTQLGADTPAQQECGVPDDSAHGAWVTSIGTGSGGNQMCKAICSGTTRKTQSQTTGLPSS